MSRLAATVLLCGLAAGARAAGIADTMHNLSVTGPGPVKATTETQICVFCHTPHSADPAGPLWNHQLPSGVTYTKYTSPTMVAYTSAAGAPDPNGATKLCLSCHDGTVALGGVENRPSPIPLQGGKTTMAAGDSGYLGTDLSRTHPISFVVTDQVVAQNNAQNTADLALQPLASMRADPTVRLDAQDRVQCTACHDPHSDANYTTSGVHFYAKADRSGPCSVCHASPAVPDQGPHLQLQAAPLAAEAAAVEPARTLSVTAAGGPAAVAPAHASPATLPLGCMSCHAGHAADDGKAALLLASGERACYRCHGDGRQAEVEAGRITRDARAVDMQAEFLKPSHHPVEFPGDHRPGETVPESNPNARRHVTCSDCHDAHATPRTSARTIGGVAPRSSPTRRFSSEAALCFLCHGPAANRPARQPDAQRQFEGLSAHPVLGPRGVTHVPSLLPPWSLASAMACGDCHGNPDPSGPAGPHGSIYAPLLVREYDRGDLRPESPGRYDLCYGCHSRTNILADQSFPYHRKHVVEQRTPCSACHSAHGSDQRHLIEFDPAIVQANPRGLRSFLPTATGGQCALSCHGTTHDPAVYCSPGVPCTPSPAAKVQAAAQRLSPVPSAESVFPGWPTP